MSIKAIDKVWSNSDQSGVQLLALIAIADYAHDDGTNAFPKIETLTKKLRYETPRAVQKVLKTLVESGELVRHDQKGPSGVNLFDLVYQDGSNWDTIEKRCKKFGTPLPPRPNGHPIPVQTDTPLTGEQTDTQNHEPLLEPSIGATPAENEKVTKLLPVLDEHEQDQLMVFGLYGERARNGSTPTDDTQRADGDITDVWKHKIADDTRAALVALLVAIRTVSPNYPAPVKKSDQGAWGAGAVDDLKIYSLAELRQFYPAAVKYNHGNNLNYFRPQALSKVLERLKHGNFNGNRSSDNQRLTKPRPRMEDDIQYQTFVQWEADEAAAKEQARE